jgi:hypothetical protein
MTRLIANVANTDRPPPHRVGHAHCAHFYDKLYQTKAERAFDPLVQLFIRYERNSCGFAGARARRRISRRAP